MHYSRAAADGTICRNACRYLEIGQPRRNANCRSAERGCYHMHTEAVDLDRKAALSGNNIKLHAVRSQNTHVFGAHVAVFRYAVTAKPLPASELLQGRVVAVYKNRAVVGKEIQHLRFSAQHPVKIAQKFKMSRANGGVKRHVRANYLAEPAHLAKVRNAHLDDRQLALLVNAQKRKRNAQLIVEIAARFMHAVFLRQHGKRHFLSRCFADAARDAKDFHV